MHRCGVISVCAYVGINEEEEQERENEKEQ